MNVMTCWKSIAALVLATACSAGDKTGEETATGSDTDTDTDTDTAADPPPGPIGPHGEIVTGPHGGSMVRITAGAFDMGCTRDQLNQCLDNERPVRTVTLTHDFYIGETEVTQGEYESVMGTNPSDDSGCGSDCPVEKVSWTTAAVFANALSSSAGLTECYTCGDSDEGFICEAAMSPYDCDGYRLPTEAEWEGAARCDEERMYAGSDDLGLVGWHTGNSDGGLHPVAGNEANDCGLYDMSGNVWEWVQDWMGIYDAVETIDPEGPETAGNRVHRGGSWDSAGSRARVSHRDENYPGFVTGDLGFRLARTVP